MADIAVLGGMIFASLVKLPVPEECEALREWHTRMQQRQSVQQWKAMVDRGAPQD
jgi:glutathione S-transferase